MSTGDDIKKISTLIVVLTKKKRKCLKVVFPEKYNYWRSVKDINLCDSK